MAFQPLGLVSEQPVAERLGETARALRQPRGEPFGNVAFGAEDALARCREVQFDRFIEQGRMGCRGRTGAVGKENSAHAARLLCRHLVENRLQVAPFVEDSNDQLRAGASRSLFLCLAGYHAPDKMRSTLPLTGVFPLIFVNADVAGIPERDSLTQEQESRMARKSTPEKPPTKEEASVAGRALRTGKASPAQIRSMAGRIESERASLKRKPKR